MRKKHIILLVFVFIVLKLSYYFSIKELIGSESSTYLEFRALFLFTFILGASIFLWSKTSEDFFLVETTLTEKFLFLLTALFLSSTSIYVHYEDYSYLPLFESNKLLFDAVALLDVSTMVVFSCFSIKVFQLSYYLLNIKRKNYYKNIED